jgi:hypothetical protein
MEVVMDNTEIQIQLMGHLEFYLKVDYDSSSNSGSWTFVQGGNHPYARFKWFPAKQGTYSVQISTQKMIVADANGNPLLSLNDMVWPPSSDSNSDGEALFPAKKGILLYWSI